MKKISAALMLSLVLLASSCKKDEDNNNICTPTVVTVTEDISTATTWDACHIYVIAVNQISVNSTLTIQPGTVVKFKDIVGDNAILVSSSGRILAEGTAAKPIVFTSYKDDTNGGDTNDDGTATSPARADWGGIILNNNNCIFKYCKFMYGGEAGAGTGQPTLEFAYYYGIIDNCTFAYCGGNTDYAGYGVVDAAGYEGDNFSITNSVFYGCVKPMRLNSFISVDNSNTFHNPANPSETNDLNGIFIATSSNEATTDVSWTETEVPFALTSSLYVGDGFKLILAENVIIKMALLPAPGFNKISIKEGYSSIEGHDLSGVVFTSYTDDSFGGDTNGDGNGSAPTSGDWYGIQDISATITTNNYCYAWSNIYNAQYP